MSDLDQQTRQHMLAALDQAMVNECRFYHIEMIEDVRVIFDVGANTGMFTVFAKSLYPDAVIEAFEPDPFNFEQLVKRHPTAKQVAMLDTVGTVPFNNTSDDCSMVDFLGDGRITVPTTTLAIEAAPYDTIDIFKCDCEGSEFPIILGTPRIVMEKIRYITMEFHDWRGPEQRQRLLDKLRETHNMHSVERPPHAAIWHGWRKNERPVEGTG